MHLLRTALDKKLIDKDSSTTYIKYPTTEEELVKLELEKDMFQKMVVEIELREEKV